MTRMELSRLRPGDRIRMDGTAAVLVRLEYGQEAFWLLIGEGGPETFHPTPRVRRLVSWARNHWPMRNRLVRT